jgi:hypothetical protein
LQRFPFVPTQGTQLRGLFLDRINVEATNNCGDERKCLKTSVKYAYGSEEISDYNGRTDKGENAPMQNFPFYLRYFSIDRRNLLLELGCGFIHIVTKTLASKRRMPFARTFQFVGNFNASVKSAPNRNYGYALLNALNPRRLSE